MWYNIPMIDDAIGQPANNAALQQFVETSVSNFYNLFYYPIAHIISFTQSAFSFEIVDYCERHRKAIEQLITQGQSTKETLYKSWSDTFKSYIFGLWPTEILGPSTILDTEFSDETIAYVSSTMAQYCHNANQGYGVMINWESEDLFRRAWKRFFETQSPAKDTIPAYGHTLDILLTAGLLITKTWVSLNYTHQMTLRMFNELTTYINSKNSRPPEATCQDSAVTSEGLKQPGDDHSGTGTDQP